jgi:hypothetical protein
MLNQITDLTCLRKFGILLLAQFQTTYWIRKQEDYIGIRFRRGYIGYNSEPGEQGKRSDVCVCFTSYNLKFTVP